MRQRVFVFSADALVYEDLAYLRTLPNFQRNGVVLEKARLIDEAPTFAKIMGVELPDVDGVCIDGILA